MYYSAHNEEALAEFLPNVVNSVMLLHTVRFGDGRLALHPPDPPLPAPIGKRLGRLDERHKFTRDVGFGIPNGHIGISGLFEEAKIDNGLFALLGGGELRVGSHHVHARLLEQARKDIVQIDDGVQVGVEDGALGQTANDAPQLSTFHQVLGQIEHHTRVHGAVLAHGQFVLVLGGPEGALLLVADLINNAAGPLGDGRKVLPERGV